MVMVVMILTLMIIVWVDKEMTREMATSLKAVVAIVMMIMQLMMMYIVVIVVVMVVVTISLI